MEEDFEMLTELEKSKKAVGLKQSRKAIKEGRAEFCYVALDADPKISSEIIELCKESNIGICEVPHMSELGRACGINVGSAVVVRLMN